MAAAQPGNSMGIPKENVIPMRSGDVIEIGDEGYRVADHVQAGGIPSMVWASVMSEISFCVTARTLHRTVSLLWY